MAACASGRCFTAPKTRKEIVPTLTTTSFKIAEVDQVVSEVLGNAAITYEYVMLHGVNDSDHHADVLAEFVKLAGQVKVNLIPYNFTDSDSWSTPKAIWRDS